MVQEVVTVFLLGHITGDFYLQSSSLAEKKRKIRKNACSAWGTLFNISCRRKYNCIRNRASDMVYRDFSYPSDA